MRVSREGNLVTLINVFETQPKLQQTLIEQWMRFTEEVKEEPGFIGAALHRSTDGTRVINYTQWRSEEDFESGCRRSTASKWTPAACSPSASIPIFTKSSISLSGEEVDCLSTSAGRGRFDRQAVPLESSFLPGHMRRPVMNSRLCRSYGGDRRNEANCDGEPCDT